MLPSQPDSCMEGKLVLTTASFTSVPGGPAGDGERYYPCGMSIRSDGQAFDMSGVARSRSGGQAVAELLYQEDFERAVVSIEKATEDLSGRRPRSAHP